MNLLHLALLVTHLVFCSWTSFEAMSSQVLDPKTYTPAIQCFPRNKEGESLALLEVTHNNMGPSETMEEIQQEALACAIEESKEVRGIILVVNNNCLEGRATSLPELHERLVYLLGENFEAFKDRIFIFFNMKSKDFSRLQRIKNVLEELSTCSDSQSSSTSKFILDAMEEKNSPRAGLMTDPNEGLYQYPSEWRKSRYRSNSQTLSLNKKSF